MQVLAILRRPVLCSTILRTTQSTIITMASVKNVPHGFLDGPAPNLTKHIIDFKKEGIPQYDGKWAVVLDGVMSQEECDLLLKAAEVTTDGQWERVGYSEHDSAFSGLQS